MRHFLSRLLFLSTIVPSLWPRGFPPNPTPIQRWRLEGGTRAAERRVALSSRPPSPSTCSQMACCAFIAATLPVHVQPNGMLRFHHGHPPRPRAAKRRMHVWFPLSCNQHILGKLFVFVHSLLRKQKFPPGNWGFGPCHQAVISGLLVAWTPGVVRDVHVVSVRIEPGSVIRQGHARPLGHGQSSMVSFLGTLLSAVLTARTRCSRRGGLGTCALCVRQAVMR